MIKVKETAYEKDALVFVVEFDDWKGEVHELTLKITGREYDEDTIKERNRDTVELERNRILANEAAKLRGIELEPAEEAVEEEVSEEETEVTEAESRVST